MPKLRTTKQVIRHIRAVVRNPSVHTTLIQTEELTRLCDAAERKRTPPTRTPPKPPNRRAA